MIRFFPLALILLAGSAGAQDCRGHSCSDDPTSVTVDTDIVEGSTNLESNAYALGLGGAAIDDCVYTWQFLFFQGVRQNKFCAVTTLAAEQEALGNHETAAKLRCTLPILQKQFSSEEECVAAVMRQPTRPSRRQAVSSDTTQARLQQMEESYEVQLSLLTEKLGELEEAQLASQQAARAKAAEQRAYKQALIEQLTKNH